MLFPRTINLRGISVLLHRKPTLSSTAIRILENHHRHYSSTRQTSRSIEHSGKNVQTIEALEERVKVLEESLKSSGQVDASSSSSSSSPLKSFTSFEHVDHWIGKYHGNNPYLALPQFEDLSNKANLFNYLHFLKSQRSTLRTLFQIIADNLNQALTPENYPPEFRSVVEQVRKENIYRPNRGGQKFRDTVSTQRLSRLLARHTELLLIAQSNSLNSTIHDDKDRVLDDIRFRQVKLSSPGEGEIPDLDRQHKRLLDEYLSARRRLYEDYSRETQEVIPETNTKSPKSPEKPLRTDKFLPFEAKAEPPRPSNIARALENYDLRNKLPSKPITTAAPTPTIISKHSSEVAVSTELDRLYRGVPIKGVRDLIFFESPSTAGETKLEPRAADNVRAMKAWAQFITTPTADTPGTSILLHFENRRYLIGNVGEGTQRACMEQKTSLVKVEDIFLSGKVNWATAGGLFGMILTLADAKASQVEQTPGEDRSRSATVGKLHLHGGRNLTHMLATARKFVFRKGLPLEVDEYRNINEPAEIDGDIQPSFQDEYIRVWPINVAADIVVPASRKRSHEEMELAGQDNHNGVHEGSEENRVKEDDRSHQICRAVVASMFNSDWQLDALSPVNLRDVTMPAAIFIHKNGKVEEYTGPKPGGTEPVPDIDVLVRQPWPGAKVDTLPRTSPSNIATSYVVKSNPIRGKFDAAAAKSLGVRPGPDYSKLVAGQSVVGKDGQIVTQEMVLGPSSNGTGFAVLDIPDTTYIDGILSRAELSSDSVMEGVAAYIWILGPGVHSDDRLKKFMATKNLQHIIASPDLGPNELAYVSAAQQAICRSVVDGARFPIPQFNNIPAVAAPEAANITIARPGKQFSLIPNFALQQGSMLDECDPGKAVESVNLEVSTLADEARKTVESSEYLQKLDEIQSDIPCFDADITTLGTGSSLPSKQRNVSANLIRVPGYGNYLLDAGENTLGQLRRVFGGELTQVLRDLKMIWISHLHADHHLGTASVIKAWHEATKDDPVTKTNQLLVASASGMLQWLREYSSVEDFGHDRVMPFLAADHTKTIASKHMTEYQREAFSLEKIDTIKVTHCVDALAVVLTWPNGFKVAYSGDCRPSPMFARVGQDATLLIHEATFDDEKQDDAMKKRHCTTAEAMDIGRQMRARRIVLTHFSQRYSKIPVMENTEGAPDQVVVVAFDYMQCKIGDLKKVAEFRPALLKLYEAQEEQAALEKAETAKVEAARIAAIEEKKAAIRRKHEAKQKEGGKNKKGKQAKRGQNGDQRHSEADSRANLVDSLIAAAKAPGQERESARVESSAKSGNVVSANSADDISTKGHVGPDTTSQDDATTRDQEVGAEIRRRLQDSSMEGEPVDLEDVRQLTLEQLMENSGYEVEKDADVDVVQKGR